MELVWNTVKQTMKASLPDHSFRMWIEPIKYLGSKGDYIQLACPNSFSRQRIRENYLAGLEGELSRLGFENAVIELKVATGKKKNRGSYPAVPVRVNAKPQEQMALPGLDRGFNCGRMLKKSFTFDNFVVGNNSDFAYSAALSLAQGAVCTNGALYLLSDTGLGKSHLSQAVGHHILSNGPSEKVYYVTAEDFTNEMVFSLRNNTIDAFKEKYRKTCDVLILEDIHFLSGKDATQKELAITLDYLQDADKKIIFSGCYLPGDIPKMNEQLKSRLTQGIVTKIDAPDFRTRVRILKKKSESKAYTIPEEVTEYLAQELTDNVRQLESGLAGVAAKGSLLGETINVDLARTVVETISRNKRRITIDVIKQLICKEYSVTEQEIISASRKKNIVKPRQMAIFLSRKHTDQPLKAIGKSFNRYHATAIYAINSVEKELKLKGALFEQMNYLNRKIQAGRL